MVQAKLSVEQQKNGVAVVTLNRPERRNALDDALLCEHLPQAISDLDGDPAVSVVVFTGAGDAFCGGADLAGCSGWTQPDSASAEDFVRRTCEVPVAVHQMSTPSIAAVNGAAVGAGFGLALSCDFRFVAPTAFFKSPFILMGLVPDYGLSYFLPRLVGMQDALDIMLTGREVPAQEASELGLAWRVTDAPLDEALAYADTLSAQPRRAAEVTRAALYRSLDRDVETEVLVDEARSQGVALHSAEFRERFEAYRAGVGTSAAERGADG